MSFGRMFRELADLPLETDNRRIVLVDPNARSYRAGFKDGAEAAFEALEDNAASLDELVDWIDGDLTAWANSDHDRPPPEPGR